MSNIQIAAQFLRTSADGLAGLATARLFEKEADYLVDDFIAWKGHLRTQVLQLAASVQSNRPDGFANHIDWVRHGFSTRGIPTGALEAAVQCLSLTANEALPPESLVHIEPHIEAALIRLRNPQAGSEPGLDPKQPKQALALAYLAALRSGDEAEAQTLLLHALQDGKFATTELIDDVLTAALREMGRLWHGSEVTVAEEHFVSQSSQRMLVRILDRAPKAPRRGKTALLTTVAGDNHSLGIQFVAAHFELKGWRTICLGANTPSEDIASLANSLSAHIVVLGTTIDTQVPSLLEAIAQVRSQCPGVRILAGGQALPPHQYSAEQIGADAIAPSGAAAEQVASELVG